MAGCVTPDDLNWHRGSSIGDLQTRHLRPTALDELGLLGAVAEFARRFSGDLDIDVVLPEAPVALPAVVEVAVYRIVTEAITNVVRHAGATRCSLTIATGADVEIDVVDDGVGIDDPGRGRGTDGDARASRGARRRRALRARRDERHPSARPAPGGSPVSPVRVVIVDDHPMFRLGLAVAVAEMVDIEIVGEADSAEAVDGLVADTKPDVVLLDIRLGDDSGLDVNRRLAERHPQTKVIMLTMSEDLDTALVALRDGARGYLVKGASPERLEHALRVVAAGDLVLDHDLAGAVGQLSPSHRVAVDRPFPQLTEREFGILDLIAEGLDNQSIARRLVLSPKTVRSHVSNVFAKLNAADRSQAIVLARRQGLGQPGDRRPSA
jgi:DNA-binding NarL/FixJ family response regulator